MTNVSASKCQIINTQNLFSNLKQWKQQVFFYSSFDAYRVASLHNVSLLFDNFIKRFRPYMYLEYFASRQH